MMVKHRVFGITGWKNNGKTTMTVNLVRELTKRGYKLATVKHAHHEFDIDKEGTDSWRHRKAGAGEVAIVSSRRWAIIHEMGVSEDELPLDAILSKLSPCDLVLVEGYKSESHAKLEVRRKEGKAGEDLSAIDPNIVAIASDVPPSASNLPIFGIDDIAKIADFIEHYMGLKELKND